MDATKIIYFKKILADADAKLVRNRLIMLYDTDESYKRL